MNRNHLPSTHSDGEGLRNGVSKHSLMDGLSKTPLHLAVSDPDSPRNFSSLNFPHKLHKILSTPEFSDIICWLPHGRAWRVQQQDRLESEVLPKFFQHQKYSSFSRQVYGWGFHRVTSGPDYNGFFHEYFLRDAPDLCLKMKRPSRTELAERRQALPDIPPDFYSMPPVSVSVTNSGQVNNGLSFPAQMPLSEYRDRLIRRMSTYSLQEKGMYLRMELDQLDQRREKVLQQLQQVRPNPTTPPLMNELPPRLASFLFAPVHPQPTCTTPSVPSASAMMTLVNMAQQSARERALFDQARLLLAGIPDK